MNISGSIFLLLLLQWLPWAPPAPMSLLSKAFLGQEAWSPRLGCAPYLFLILVRVSTFVFNLHEDLFQLLFGTTD